MNVTRIFTRLAGAAVVTAVMVTGVATSASAQDHFRINTAGGDLQVRSGPGTGYKPVRKIADDAPVTISCQVYGTTVKGTYGTSNVWDRIGSGQYVADAYVWTGHDGKFLKTCGSSGTPSTGLVDDYPYRGQSREGIDRWRFYKTECVSFVAWRVSERVRPDFKNFYRGERFSNAKNWDNVARRLGFRVDNKPSVGAVAQWNGGTFGHVAYVAKVHKNGTVTIEEYNKGGSHRYGTRTIKASSVENYIHF